MKTTTILATVILLATTTLAQTGVIFTDNFNRPVNNSVGNGWVETEFGASDAQIINTALQLTQASATHQVSTLGLFSTSLSFDYAAVIVGTLDILMSLDDATHTALASFPLTSGTFQHVALYVPQADNQADVWFRFQVGGPPGVAQVDNVEVSVPEPATLALFGLGLLGLGVVARRRRYS